MASDYVASNMIRNRENFHKEVGGVVTTSQGLQYSSIALSQSLIEMLKCIGFSVVYYEYRTVKTVVISSLAA